VSEERRKERNLKGDNISVARFLAFSVFSWAFHINRPLEEISADENPEGWNRQFILCLSAQIWDLNSKPIAFPRISTEKRKFHSSNRDSFQEN
jgi:hypothetical protein